MSQSLNDVLAGRNYGEPPELQQIKKFVQAEVGLVPRITITTEAYVLHIPSAAAAGTLRAKLFQLQKQLNTTKRLVIRIG